MPFEFPSTPDTSRDRMQSFDKFLTSELPRQFVAQRASLFNTGFTELQQTSEDGALVLTVEEGTRGPDGTFYTFPTQKQIADYWESQKEIIATKMEQGFTRLLIVPFASPLNMLLAKTEAVILDHHKRGRLLDDNNQPLKCDTENPLECREDFKGADESGGLVYNVTKFDKENHGGKTKQEILSDPDQPFPGFRVLLILDNLTIPREGKGETKGSRKALETNKPSADYLNLMQTNPNYAAEQGLTIEDWFTLIAIHLHDTNHVIDNWQDNKNSATLLTGCFHIGSGDVPYADWNRDGEQAYVGRNRPTNQDGDIGCRPAVGG